MKPRRISKTYAAGLVAVAAFFDLLSLIPGVSIVTGAVGQLTLAALFWFGGVSVFRDKKLVTYIFATLVEVAPQASFLPFFIVETLAIISISWAKRQ